MENQINSNDMRNAALEEAAKIADQQHFGGQHDDDSSWTDCAAHIAQSIRAIKRQDPADKEGWDGLINQPPERVLSAAAANL